MSWETVKAGRSKGRSVDNRVYHTKPRQETESEIRCFLESYKTKPCCRADSNHLPAAWPFSASVAKAISVHIAIKKPQVLEEHTDMFGNVF